jgi:hypothetical protein
MSGGFCLCSDCISYDEENHNASIAVFFRVRPKCRTHTGCKKSPYSSHTEESGHIKGGNIKDRLVRTKIYSNIQYRRFYLGNPDESSYLPRTFISESSANVVFHYVQRHNEEL